MYFAGLDIHKAFTFGVIKDKDGNVLSKEKFTNTDEHFDEFFKDFPPNQTKIVIESTCIWEYIYDKLEKRGYSTKVANPKRTKAIAFARIKTDAIDASTLADLLRADLIAESYVPPKEIRRLRDVVRQRKTIAKGRTQIKNKIHAIFNMHGIKLPYKSLCPSAIDWTKQNIDVTDVLQSYFNLLEQYGKELKFIEKNIEEMAKKDKQAYLLKTIPGIGSIRAMEILAEVGEVKRFPDATRLCSYAGLVPSIHQSGNTLRMGGLIKEASKSLKNALVEASWVAVRTKEANSLKVYYLRLKDKKGKQKAICATARKMLCIIYAILIKEQEFRA